MKRAVGKGEKREVQLEKEKVGKSRWKEQKNRNCKERKKRKKIKWVSGLLSKGFCNILMSHCNFLVVA